MDTVEKINPIVAFIYFACVIVLAMIITNPFYLAVSVAFSLISSLALNREKSKKMFFFFGLTGVFIAVINPLLNTMGETVLFTYFGGRPYTLEALIYGVIMAMLFFTVINWFSCYSSVITSDKFMYIFGSVIPSTSLLLSMVLRLVPVYREKLKSLSQSRKAIGKGVDSPKYMEKARQGLTLVSALTSSALENSIVTACSMESRGYGTGKRTTFSLYKFGKGDLIIVLILLAVFAAVLISCVFLGAPTEFIPRLEIPALDGWLTFGFAVYSLLLSLPTIVVITGFHRKGHLYDNV